jgi:hypothetical protein
MIGKKRTFFISVASFLILFAMACSVGGATTQIFDPTMATLEAQLTLMSQQLTDAAPGGGTPSMTQEDNLLAPGDLYVGIKTKTPTATTHLEIAIPSFFWTYVNEATGLCLDSNADGHAYTMACNGGTFQKWSGDGQALVNAETGLCLDSNAGGQAYTLACNGGNFQKWTVSGKALINVATGLCLDSNSSGDLYTMGCNGGSFQNWK